MPEFNLIDSEWIPCLMHDGKKPRELSLRDVLLEAHNIREVFDDSPLVTVALHRLLLAILHRNLGPASFSEWKELWKRGRCDGEVIMNYLERWRHRFNLFDEARPFFQVPRLQKASAGKKAGKKGAAQEAEGEAVELQPVAKLAHEAAAGNNATLFDHSFKIIQNFAPSNLNRSDTGSPKDCEFGGVRRARISSQCFKRSIRREGNFAQLLEKLGGSVRTRRLVIEIAKAWVPCAKTNW